MKKQMLNILGAILITFASVLILSEYDFKDSSGLLHFLFIKVIGFGIGYLGYKMIDFKD